MRLLIAAALLSLSAVSAAEFNASYGEDGPSALTLDGQQLIKAPVAASSQILLDKSGTLERITAPGIRAFDPETRSLRITYDWGTLTCAFAANDGRLDLALNFENTSTHSIADWTVPLLAFAFAETPKGEPWRRGFEIKASNYDDIAFIPVEMPGRRFVICVTDLDPPALLSFSTPDGDNVRTLRFSTALWDSAENVSMAPGEKRTYHISLRPLSGDAEPHTAITDILKAFAHRHPRVLNWKDHRAIGMLMIASNAHRSPSNPGGWLNDPTLDAGNLKTFRQKMLAQADTAVSNLKKMDAQGMIFWSPEGERVPNISYVGDPRMIQKLAPEMDAIADEFFARFTKAKLRTGICIRPSRLDTSDKDPANWRHGHMGFDVAGELSEKIAYAQKRWGCTIFYIDTNTHWFYRRDGGVEGRPFDAAILRDLMKRHPDVLLIPEIPVTAYWAYSAPYRELREHAFGGHAETPDYVRAIWPDAFSLINPIDGPIPKRRDDLIRGVRHGNILLFRCWFNDPGIQAVRDIYKAAAKNR